MNSQSGDLGMRKAHQTFISDLYPCLGVLTVRSVTQTDQPRLASGVKYGTKTSRLDRGVTSRVFAKVLLCS